MNDEILAGNWQELLERDYIIGAIYDIAEKFPEINSISISLKDLLGFGLWDILREDPDKGLAFGKRQILETISNLPLTEIPQIKAEQIVIRLTEGHIKLNIKDIRQEHRNHIVEVEGIIRRSTKISSMMVSANFKCKRCSSEFFEKQEGILLKVPENCPNPNCDRGGPFDLLDDQSIFVDTQWLYIQKAFDKLEDGRQEPQSIEVLVRGDLVGKFWPGDKVRSVGICRSRRKDKSSNSTIFSPFIDNLHMEAERTGYKDIKLSQEEERAIIDEAMKPDHIERLIKSVAPSIYGFDYVKLGLLLQQVGGCTIELPDSSVSRGEIHVLLMGDPSTGKSILLQYISKLSPKCSKGAGGGSSGVGITASVIKDNLEGWVLEAGVLPMANGGLAVVDEFDKLREDDKAKLHEALEQGEIHIDKAGIHAVLPTRCAMLAAANPKLGRFDGHEPLVGQINLAPALISSVSSNI
jgi:replicative DNA helicase Mcm